MTKSLPTFLVAVLLCSAALSCGGGGSAANRGSGGQAGTPSSGGISGVGGKAGAHGTAGAGGGSAGAAGTVGTGGSAPGTGGGAPGTGGSNVSCGVTNTACTLDAQCCSHACDQASGTCASMVSTCNAPGGPCGVATDCCNLRCDMTNGVCSTAASCVADNQACISPSACCSGACSNGTCQPLNTTCNTAGNPCTPTTSNAGGGCCSGLCSGGKCVLGASFCIQPGDVCARDLDCCGGFCSKASGAALGTCQDVQATGAGTCQHDGVLCNGCGSCCSKNCGPWAQTGVSVCQPGLGCKILNSLCTSSADCCGGDTGAVTCVPATGPTGISIGVCAQNHGNQVPGGICKLNGGTNSCANAESDCTCAVSPKVACCAFDTLGLPRCLGSGTCADGTTGVFSGTDPNCCRKAGQTCNTASECCGLVPCVPDSTGVRHCLTTPPNDGGIVCVDAGGACTATGDCCTGMICSITPGASSGTCGTPPPSPTPDAGTPPAADAGPPPNGGNCALFGQECGGDVQCCTGNCMYSPTNTPCMGGQTGCTCY